MIIFQKFAFSLQKKFLPILTFYLSNMLDPIGMWTSGLCAVLPSLKTTSSISWFNMLTYYDYGVDVPWSRLFYLLFLIEEKTLLRLLYYFFNEVLPGVFGPVTMAKSLLTVVSGAEISLNFFLIGVAIGFF